MYQKLIQRFHFCPQITLESRINVHARLLNFDPFFPNHGLIRDCTFIYFWPKIPPARLLRACTILVCDSLTWIPPTQLLLIADDAAEHETMVNLNKVVLLTVKSYPYLVLDNDKSIWQSDIKCPLLSVFINSNLHTGINQLFYSVHSHITGICMASTSFAQFWLVLL